MKIFLKNNINSFNIIKFAEMLKELNLLPSNFDNEKIELFKKEIMEIEGISDIISKIDGNSVYLKSINDNIEDVEGEKYFSKLDKKIMNMARKKIISKK